MLTIFFWLSTISQMLLHPYFIFDGPDRPEFQGGNDCASGGPCLLVEHFQELLNAFGFGWHTVHHLHGLLQMLIRTTRLQEKRRQSLPAFNQVVLLMLW